MNISICLPSRNRPKGLDRVYESAMDTARQKDTIEFIVRLDNDDLASLDAKCLKQDNVKTIIGPRVILSSTWTEAARLGTSSIFLQGADDIVFRTPGWDQVVIAAFNQFPDQIVLVHGKDLVHDQVLGTHCFISRQWIHVLGYMVPPYFCSDYADLWTNEVANSLGRRVYIPDVVIEHCHFSVGKADKDITYQERETMGGRMNVKGLYEALRPRMLEDVEKLRPYLSAPVPDPVSQ